MQETKPKRLTPEELRDLNGQVYASLYVEAGEVAVKEIEWDEHERFSAVLEDGRLLWHGPGYADWLEF